MIDPVRQKILEDIDNAQVGEPHECARKAIDVYLAATGIADDYKALASQAKEIIAQIMLETGKDKYGFDSGSVSVTAPSKSVSYDAKGLDDLLLNHPELHELLWPYREEKVRDGSMRITRRGARDSQKPVFKTKEE